ncbi:phosphoribosyltransferase [Psychrobacillus psychrotolerans]|uniref:phosphoribosyltransferase n=1 Tax=Psychrobacillus psychrotolerans TaxID=126156 RepID=UPI003314A88B
MSRIIIFPTATLKDSEGEIYPGVEELLNNLNSEGNKILLLSHRSTSLKDMLEDYKFTEFISRRDIRSYISSNEEDFYILVGSSDVDLQLASNKKILLINPLWSHIQEAKAVRYGLSVKSPEGLHKVLRILKNQTAWYYTLNVEEGTTIYSLSRANYKGYVESQNEVELIQAFEKILKNGNKRYFKLLLLHFLGSIINNPEFKAVDIWAIMPSSTTELNKDMQLFKDRAREIMGKQLKEPLFVRHTATYKSRGQSDSKRIPCDRHFDTIKINPEYEGKLRGKNICVLDDFLNNGTSFETLRNLLRHEGVKTITFVSLGKFQRRGGIEYHKQDYVITGDVYSEEYSYTLKSTSGINGIFNNQAREDIRELYNIITE